MCCIWFLLQHPHSQVLLTAIAPKVTSVPYSRIAAHLQDVTQRWCNTHVWGEVTSWRSWGALAGCNPEAEGWRGSEQQRVRWSSLWVSSRTGARTDAWNNNRRVIVYRRTIGQRAVWTFRCGKSGRRSSDKIKEGKQRRLLISHWQLQRALGGVYQVNSDFCQSTRCSYRKSSEGDK